MASPGDARKLALRIDGLADIRRDIRKADRNLVRRFDRELKKAVKPMVARAQELYRQKWTQHTGKSAKNIRVGTHRGGPALVFGSDVHPYLIGQEWGSRGRYPQFTKYGHTGKHGTGTGTFAWPAFIEGREQVEKDIIKALDQAVKEVAGRL